MKHRWQAGWIAILLVVSLPVAWRMSCRPAAAQAQPQAEAVSTGTSTIKVETREVLVDTVVTDKKGNYVRDLTAKDFKVWEDGKEQTVTSFSREDETLSPSHPQKHYLVLFFDNSTMEFSDQARARDAAAKFIDANAGPDRLIAIIDFAGALHIAQNFTADAERLKKVVAGIKTSTVSPNAPEVASLNMPQSSFIAPSLTGLEAEFAQRSVLLALRDLAKNLASVPGRKTLVMLTSGFPITPELQSELTAVIDACNKANVAVYPIDVRGLVVPSMVTSPTGSLVQPKWHPASGQLVPVALKYQGNVKYPLLRLAELWAEPPEPAQRGGGGGGGGSGGGGRGGGGTGGGPGGGGGTGGGGGHGGGGTGGTGGTGGGGSHGGGTGGGRGVAGGGNPIPTFLSPYDQPRQIVPPFPDSATTNQQLLYQLANGTGGFVIVNTNDLLGGMEKIAKDQSEYYLLGYKPADSPEGSCHTLRVKVERGGTNVRARSGYCKVRPLDLLAGSSTEKDLESRAAGEMPGNVTASMEAPFFYTSPNVARIHLAIDIPSNSLKFEKVKGKQHSAVNVLGIAYLPDGSIAARFSDTVNLDFDGKKEQEEFQKQPFRYENQFEIASGKYNLRVVFSSGNESFGKLELPLAIDTYNGKQLNVSGLAMTSDLRRVSDLDTDLDAQLLSDRKPLVVQGMQFVPSASNHFKKTDNALVYFEVYDPLLTGAAPPKIALEYRIVDQKTGEKKLDVGVTDTEKFIKAGSPVVPIGLKVPVATLAPGGYRAEVRAVDTAGNQTPYRSAEFELE